MAHSKFLVDKIFGYLQLVLGPKSAVCKIKF